MFKTTFRKILQVENLLLGDGAFHWRISDNVIHVEDPEMGGKFSVHLDAELEVKHSGVWWIDNEGKKHGLGVSITRDLVESDLENANAG